MSRVSCALGSTLDASGSLNLGRDRGRDRGSTASPWTKQDPILGLIYERRPDIYAGFRHAYSTLWVSTPLIASNVVFSLLSILVTPGTAS